MKKCKQGYYYCYTDEVCKRIPKGLRVTARFSGGGKEPEETGIDVPTNGNEWRMEMSGMEMVEEEWEKVIY